MSNVRHLPTPLERGPHNHGPAFCSQCHHEWTAVAAVGVIFLECPECHTYKGLFKGPIEPANALWTCNCGCTIFCISDTTNILCINCGTAHDQRYSSED